MGKVIFCLFGIELTLATGSASKQAHSM